MNYNFFSNAIFNVISKDIYFGFAIYFKKDIFL